MPGVGDIGRSRIHWKEKVGSFLFIGVKNYNILNSKKGLNTCEICGYKLIKIGQVKRGSWRGINKFKLLLDCA